MVGINSLDMRMYPGMRHLKYETVHYFHNVQYESEYFSIRMFLSLHTSVHRSIHLKMHYRSVIECHCTKKDKNNIGTDGDRSSAPPPGPHGIQNKYS